MWRLTYSLQVIPIGVYSSITYIDFVLQYLNNNNNSSNNNKVNNIKEMLQVKVYNNVSSVCNSLDVYDSAKI